MHIEFTHTRTPEYFRRQFARGADMIVGPVRMVGVIVAFAALFIALAGEFAPKALFTGGALLALAAALFGFAFWRWKRAVTVPESWLNPRTWVLTTTSFTSSTENSSAEVDWSAFGSVQVTEQAYLLVTRQAKIYDIPREPLTAEQDAELRAFLHDLAPAAG
ncbi:YcxB family protein [Actinoplanes utahensis]|uniref:YcxB-like C-terminal domain-containing protein n=1 Tax=Actinoplanes utahensis TaxID=1869 RepID=A0A0A6UQF1_ACTUT|nr:YcxB family protein [Actinoplanes utahensis]KHD78345.1 hypothetical protein MB27_05800 [Actinoplanes utahensis]GIF28958.1 hypothetical protein Aut01nite_19440 [Actinoplanes utahensis]